MHRNLIGLIYGQTVLWESCGSPQTGRMKSCAIRGFYSGIESREDPTLDGHMPAAELEVKARSKKDVCRLEC
jgi:hypothetical protein